MITQSDREPSLTAGNRTLRKLASFGAALLLIAIPLPLAAQNSPIKEPALPREAMAQQYFGADAPWFLNNIPFLEIDDPEIQQIYFYRWKLLRSHIREIGPQGTTILEFLDNVPWARQPFTDLNDSAPFHLMEARWMRDPAVVDDLIDHLYTGAANDRHFSESIAAATEATTLVTGDPGPALRHLDTMQYIYNAWDDHFDRARNLYWIEPLPDATEYTISSIDASGAGFTDHPSKDQNHNGFTGGFAYRPSINSYQYANATAIARIATEANQPDVANDYRERAERLRSAMLAQLWNPELQHFTDRYQRSTPYVTADDFIRGRELVGYVPWAFELPPHDDSTSSKAYAKAWSHLLSPDQLAGSHGLRTVEPSYPRYLTQYRYEQATGRPECQWNGPSWPFQTSQALTGLANLLDDYPSAAISKADYLRLLRQYTNQHFLSPGKPDIEEDYNPDTGVPIVGLPRSHHYFHSTYIDLVLSGLIGIRPRADNVLELDPLVPVQHGVNQRIRYFALQDLVYHHHDVSVFYDEDGSHYHLGAGLSIFVDHRRISGPGPLAPTRVNLPPVARAITPPTAQTPVHRIDLATNPGFPDGPLASASSADPADPVEQAIDGRLWFFPKISNGWSPSLTDTAATSWYQIDLRTPESIGSIELYFFADGEGSEPPSSFQLQYKDGDGWRDIPTQARVPQTPIANGENRISFPPLRTQQIRIVFKNPPAPAQLRLIEAKVFAPKAQSPKE
jgi:F5/8 type C domain/Amylo-alpha-1,6-glucosidase